MMPPRALVTYTRTSEQAAARLIAGYSTSFSLAARLLGRRHRHHVRNIYAVVRVADELVDGILAELGLDAEAAHAALDAYERATLEAMHRGFSTDPVLHAFGFTARTAGIEDDLVTAFFASMRTDLDAHLGVTDGILGFDAEAHAQYVYGSAEVVGLMCLRVFHRHDTPSAEVRRRTDHGARQLGAAFQNVNFLRDLADDRGRLGRSYLAPSGVLTDEDKDRWVATVRDQLAQAEPTIALLPRDARAAVRSAWSLFAALTEVVARTPVDQLRSERVRVPDPVKLRLTARAVLRTWKDGRR